MLQRKKTRKIFIGRVPIGDRSPISVQSMTKTDTRNIKATVEQIHNLENLGCEIIRIAVPDMIAAQALGAVKKSINIPIIADIHFDWKLALESLRQEVDGLRLNPGNIGAKWKIKEVVLASKDRNIPIRIGVNAGSLEKDLLIKYKYPTSESLVESAERHIDILEGLGFNSIKVSLKASNVLKTVEAYKLFSKKFNYPLHIGISEAGPLYPGTVKGVAGLAILLYQGIGDTLRVSLTAEPEEEVRLGYEILKSLGIRQRGVEIISCPTCGRCQIDLKSLVEKVQKAVECINRPLTIAVMGCVVNGPGEACESDFGIAGGKAMGLIFKKGVIVKKVPQGKLLDELMKLIDEEIKEIES